MAGDPLRVALVGVVVSLPLFQVGAGVCWAPQSLVGNRVFPL